MALRGRFAVETRPNFPPDVAAGEAAALQLRKGLHSAATPDTRKRGNDAPYNLIKAHLTGPYIAKCLERPAAGSKHVHGRILYLA